MWNPLKLLTTFLCAQVCVGQMAYRIVPAVDPDGLRGSSPGTAHYGVTQRQASTAVNTVVHSFGQEFAKMTVNTGDGFGQEVAQPGDRELQAICILIVTFTVISMSFTFSENTVISIVFTLTDADGDATTYPTTAEIDTDGVGISSLAITSSTLLDATSTALCIDCTISAEVGVCIFGDCTNYDIAATQLALVIMSAVCGDPHMVGLLGQKIDWAGEDGGWYCLVSDGDYFQLNARVTAPMPEEFPDRQLVTGVSLLLANGHSLVVEVKNPYTIETDGCVAGNNSPCLADGALRVLVDNEEVPNLQIPAEKVVVADGVHVSATNLPAECRPFGGDVIWAAQFEEIMTGRRSLREASPTLDEWVLEPDTLAAPTWCKKYLEGGVADLLATQSNHATLRIETPTVDLRINIGVNHQELVLGDDGSIVVPELEFWQTDIGLERHNFPDSVGGMLGDTTRFVYDSDGHPIREGLDALHGPVESYRVADALGVDFEQLNHE